MPNWSSKKAAQERSLAAQLDAAFRQGEHTGIQLILSGEESQRGQRLQAYFGYLNQARQETIAQLKQTREEVAMQRAELEEKQSEQQTLLYEQRAQQAKLTQALSERKKTLAGLESSIQQGQQQLSELRANESRLRNSIARAEAAAKARAEREAREAQAVRDRQKEATRKRHHLQADRKRKIADVPNWWPGCAAWSGILAGSRADAASLW